MATKLERDVRLLKTYAVAPTLLCGVFVLAAFTQSGTKDNFEEVIAKRMKIVDSNGKFRVLMGADLKGLILPGCSFLTRKGM